MTESSIQTAAELIAPADRPAAIAALRARLGAEADPARRLGSIALRAALIRLWQRDGQILRPAAPEPEPEPEPAPAPPPPRGVVKLMALEDAARMLMTHDEPEAEPEPPPPPGPAPISVDFSMFEDTEPEEVSEDAPPPPPEDTAKPASHTAKRGRSKAGRTDKE